MESSEVFALLGGPGLTTSPDSTQVIGALNSLKKRCRPWPALDHLDATIATDYRRRNIGGTERLAAESNKQD